MQHAVKPIRGFTAYLGLSLVSIVSVVTKTRQGLRRFRHLLQLRQLEGEGNAIVYFFSSRSFINLLISAAA